MGERVDHSEVNQTEWKSMIRALASCVVASLLSATPAVAQNHIYFSTPHYGGGYNYRHSSTGNFGTFMPSAASGHGHVRADQGWNQATFGHAYRTTRPSFRY